MRALLDTGFVLALLATNDPYHERCLEIMAKEQNPLLPTAVLPELAYMTIRNVGLEQFLSFIRFAIAGKPRLVFPVTDDFSRAASLMEQYADGKIDFVDCMVAAMAERLNISRILTVDQRDFRILRPSHIPAFEILP